MFHRSRVGFLLLQTCDRESWDSAFYNLRVCLWKWKIWFKSLSPLPTNPFSLFYICTLGPSHGPRASTPPKIRSTIHRWETPGQNDEGSRRWCEFLFACDDSSWWNAEQSAGSALGRPNGPEEIELVWDSWNINRYIGRSLIWWSEYKALRWRTT
jgi:hypothetical protein